MVKLGFINLIVVTLITISSSLFANPNLDQWLDTEKTYKDLIDEGYEVKATLLVIFK